MKLMSKYNMTLLSGLAVCFVVIGGGAYYILHKHAREEVIRSASILMEAALAMRKYTVTEIKPLLALQNKRNFLPQSVPSYAATQNFNALRDNHPEYRYKEATLNPTNPRDRAADWEADIIHEFRNYPDRDNITLERDTPLGKTLYYAKPIRIKNQGCLTCHGVIEDAPETMIKLYGPANGFGWKMDEVVGSQIVSVPLSIPVARANETFLMLMAALAVAFLFLFLLLNLSVRRTFVKRLVHVSAVVEDVNQGKMRQIVCDTKGNDEISSLCESVEHLCRQYHKASKMLDDSMDYEGAITERSDR